MASFFIPLTGLESDSTALNTIANDLANMNTTAFKAETTNFSDLFYQQIGSTGAGDPIQVGAGVQVASNELNFSQGSINSSGNATDVALNGNGFFVISNGAGGYELTRDGNFTQAANGNLLSNGMSVMGYPAVNGVVNTTAPLTAVNIPVGAVQESKATTTMSMTANLDSATAVNGQFPAEVTVYDSLGQAHTVTVTYTAEGNNTWGYSVALPSADYATAPPAPLVSGTMTFDSSGNLADVNGTPVTGAGAVTTITLNLNPAGPPAYPLADGAAGLNNIQWNLLGSAGTPSISQVDTTSAVSATAQDGYASGQYQSFAIGSDGTVTITYSNGQKQNVAQLALGNVTNLQGLQLMGDGNYTTTRASGPISFGTSGTSGLGTLQDDALEASNVNISTEFSDLIIAQRAFEANAKSVTTFDTVTQDTINMVH